jgi:chromosome segregation ATPase
MFNLWPKNEVKEIIDNIPKLAWKFGTYFYIDEKEYSVGELVDYIKNLLKENKDLNDILKSIEEDGTIEHNNAINLRESVAHLREEAEKFYNENIQLTKEVLSLRHLKIENVELIERLEKEGKSYGITCNEAKTQIIQNDYKKCAEERDEYKHQLNAANKEIEILKKDIQDYIFEKSDEYNTLKALYERAKKVVEGVEVDLDKSLDEQSDKEPQKHPMYPLHWGGYDGAASAYPKQYSDWLNEQKDKAIKEKYDKNIIDFVESEFSNEDPVEGKQVEFNSEELLKRVTEYADTLDSLPKSFPDEFQDEEWKCPCSICKEGNVSWEEVASDLALRVANLEKKVEAPDFKWPVHWGRENKLDSSREYDNL